VTRVLIVNADDLGQSSGVNRGIARAHENGIVTSASLMVRFPAAAEAADYAREHQELSVGLHVDLGEWAFRDEQWRAVYELPAADTEQVVAEVERQLAEFRRLVGEDPTHLDSHQHVHRDEPVRGVVLELGNRLGVPVRGFDERVRYVGDFFGQANGRPYPDLIGVDSLIGLLRALPDGTTELGCHPGFAADLVSSYRDERAVEVATLCHPRVRAAIADEGIELQTFRAV
jgi:predicted glycoside hydrolase/deacetylase ChbG (UPF0249 family)